MTSHDPINPAAPVTHTVAAAIPSISRKLQRIRHKEGKNNTKVYFAQNGEYL
jgi:hypothetical protein